MVSKAVHDCTVEGRQHLGEQVAESASYGRPMFASLGLGGEQDAKVNRLSNRICLVHSGSIAGAL